MQEKILINLSGQALNELAGTDPEKEKLLFKELELHRSPIEQMLVSYYFKSRGRVFDVQINEPVFTDKNTGRFRLDYKIGHFYACADLDSHEEERMQVNFLIDLLTGQLILTGEDFPEREPDEL